MNGTGAGDRLVQRGGGPPGGLGLGAKIGQPLARPGQLLVGLADRPGRQALAGLAGLGVQLGLQLADRVEQVQGLLGVRVDQLEDLALDGRALGRGVP